MSRRHRNAVARSLSRLLAAASAAALLGAAAHALAQQPPVEPPAAEPPAGEQPAAEPPAAEPPAAEPPAAEPPAAEPPAAEPPAAEPPAAEPPVAEPPAAEATRSVAESLAADHLQLRLPEGTRLSRVLDDARAGIYHLGLPGAGPTVELYVIDLADGGVAPADEKALNKRINGLVFGMLGIERALGFDAKGRTVIKMAACQAPSHTYKDDEHEVRVVGCAHPSGHTLYLWRLDLVPELAARHAQLVREFEALLIESVDLLDQTGQPIGRAAPPAPDAGTDAGTEDGSNDGTDAP